MMTVRRFIMQILRRKLHLSFGVFAPFGFTPRLAPHFGAITTGWCAEALGVAFHSVQYCSEAVFRRVYGIGEPCLGQREANFGEIIESRNAA
jgi:hypothetical protein